LRGFLKILEITV